MKAGHVVRKKPQKISPYLLDTRKVKELKEQFGVSDYDIARRARKTPSVITRTIFNQHRGPSTQRAIARFFGLKLEDIIIQPFAPITVGQQEDQQAVA